MLPKLLMILLAGLLCEAVAVVHLNRGLRQIGEVKQFNATEVLRLVKNGATNPHVVLGVFLEAVYFGTLLVLLSKGNVSFVWPLTSLSFVLTTMAAKFFLHEQVSWLRWCGVLLIMLGAGVISFTEKQAEQNVQKPAASASAESIASQ